jgi:hypothetical protein
MNAQNLPIRHHHSKRYFAVNLLGVVICLWASEGLLLAQAADGSQGSQAISPRFSPLPIIQEEATVSLSRFSPIPSLDELPAAPEGLIELANHLALNVPAEQEKAQGSDLSRKMVRTEGVEGLSKPLDPFKIVQNSDPKKSSPNRQALIDKSWKTSISQESPEAQPDPRYFNHWPSNGATWQSPAFCYKPLYFEQPNLERYGIGHSCPTNSFLSGARFFADVALLPVHALCQPPHSCECTLGHRRPGDCNPIQR